MARFIQIKKPAPEGDTFVNVDHVMKIKQMPNKRVKLFLVDGTSLEFSANITNVMKQALG